MKAVGYFLASLLILVVIGGIIFVMGFVNLAIPQGYIGVYYSSKRGYELVSQNERRWNIERLIPFSNQLVIIPQSFTTINVDISNNLPNTSLFAKVLAAQGATGLDSASVEEAFSYSLQGSLAFRLKGQSAIEALQAGTMQAKTVKSYIDGRSASLQTSLKSVVNGLVGQNTLLLNDNIALNSAVLGRLNQLFTDLELSQLSLNFSKIPNIELYNEALNTTLAAARAVSIAETASALRRENVKAEQQDKLRLLSEYGKLLSEYPILIQFFAIDTGKLLPRDVLSDFIPTTPTPLATIEGGAETTNSATNPA
jgi:hypothetical protein